MPETPTLTMQRDRLMALSAGTDSYRFLSVGLQAIRQTPEDVQLRLRLVRHYAMLGLAEAALDEASVLPEPVRQELAAAGALGQLEGVPSGRVPWAQLEGRFEANLRVLAGRFPELERVRQEWARHGDRLELYRCRDGNYQVCTRDDRGGRAWLPRLIDHKGDAERTPIPGLTDGILPPPYLVEGVGLGWYFQKLVEGTRERFLEYRPAIYLLEPNPVALAAALHLHHWSELLAEPRIFVFTGPDCGERYVELLAKNPELPVPRQHVAMVGWGAKLEPRPATRGGEIATRRNEQCRKLVAEVEGLYAGCDGAYWARRYAQAGAHPPWPPLGKGGKAVDAASADGALPPVTASEIRASVAKTAGTEAGRYSGGETHPLQTTLSFNESEGGGVAGLLSGQPPHHLSQVLHPRRGGRV